MSQNPNLFLFSIDLEDVRDRIPNGHQYRERVPEMTQKYLAFLADNNMKATFFTVGNTARAYPSLINEITSEGHEIGCHSDMHLPLTSLNKASFKIDLERNLESLYSAGANNITGFRAPTFSLVKKTEWAYEVLEELNFKYSSSVLPAKNPLFGWPEFGKEFKLVNNKIWELPITLTGTPFLNVPFAGGVYFRILPAMLVNYAFAKAFKNNQPVLSYFHPYDIDYEQERFMHPEINNSSFYNLLLYYNRKNVFGRMNSLMKEMDMKIIPYTEYVSKHLA